MAQRYNTGNQRPSNSMKDLNDNALAYDDFLNGEEEVAYDRFQKPFPTVRRQVAERIDEITGAQKSIEQYADEAKQSADNAQNIADANTYYTSQTDPDGTIVGIAGTPDGKMFRVAINDDSDVTVIFKYYKNAAGTAEYINAEASARVIYQMEQAVNYMKLISPQGQSNILSGYHVMFTDVSGKIGLFGVNDSGGLEIAGMAGNVQSYLTNLVSDSFSSKIDGYQFVFLSADNKTAVAAIDDDGYLWLAGMDEPVQTAIANSGGKGAERLARPDGTGRVALYASEDDTTPLWSKSPVVSAEKVTDTGISFVYNDAGTLKSALIPTTPLQNATTETIRELNSESQEMHFFAGRGQSLRVGANGGAVAPIHSLIGYCLMFSGAGRDRGAGIDGDVTDETLGALADARLVNFRNNCQVPEAQTILLNHQARNANMPIIVTRLDARGGFNYNQLKKGTQPYIDGTTSFDAFCKRAESVGKRPICKLIGFTHGEADANKASLQFGEYKSYLVQWSNDTQADMMARSGQTEKPFLNVDQLGSLTNTTVINGITQRGYVVAIDQLEFTNERAEAFMGLPKWLLNREYPQDLLHLSGLGYCIKGEYLGKSGDFTVYDRLNNPTGNKFKPVQPISINKVNTTTFDITFSSPYGLPLQVKAVKGIMAPNLGFDLQNGTANVTAVTQQSDFVFRVVTDVAPTVGDYFRLGCTATDNGANSYPLINIFDTTTTVSRHDPNFVMVNPCAISRIAVI